MNELLRLIRVYQDFKAIEFAEMLGISKSYLSEIEKGHKQADIKLLQKYTDISGIKLKYFFAFTENKKKNIAKLKKHMEQQLFLYLQEST